MWHKSLSIALILITITEISLAKIICYECWTPSESYVPIWPPQSNWTLCEKPWRLRECIGNFSADMCFSFNFKKQGVQAKGCATFDMVAYKIVCRYKMNKKGFHCNSCNSHLCNSANPLTPTLLITIFVVLFTYFKNKI